MCPVLVYVMFLPLLLYRYFSLSHSSFPFLSILGYLELLDLLSPSSTSHYFPFPSCSNIIPLFSLSSFLSETSGLLSPTPTAHYSPSTLFPTLYSCSLYPFLSLPLQLPSPFSSSHPDQSLVYRSPRINVALIAPVPDML